jgi:2-polyprenyl-6-methoxyphenol hydroxylase-like FAD-dependent oxidoreductase
MEFPWGKDGEVKHEVVKADAELIRNWPGLLYDNTRDYINWSWWASSDKFPADVLQRRGEDLIQLSIDMNPMWHPDLHKLMRMGDPSTCFPISIYTSEPIPQWETTNITLLGDAVHTMTPGRGVGANTALRDAALIVRNLARFRDGEMSLHDAVRDYETKMIKYGFDAVEQSRKQTSGDDPMHKPVIGRIVLAGTRTFARIVNHVPAFKRKMSDSLYTYRGGDREED